VDRLLAGEHLSGSDLTRGGPLAHHLERALADADPTHAVVDPPCRQTLLRDGEAPALLSEQVGPRNSAVLVHDLGVAHPALADVTHHRNVADPSKAGRIGGEGALDPDVALELVEAPLGGEGWALNSDDVWLVLGPGNYGPCRYDGERLYHLKLSKSPAEAAHRAKYPDAAFSPSGVYSIYKDRRGHMWFGTAAVGLCRYDGQVLSWMYEERLTTTPSGGAFGIRSVYQDRAGDFWVCNTRQRFEVLPENTLEDGYSLIKYEKKEGLPDAQSDTDRNFTYYPSMTEDDAGALWMACGGDGVWKYDGKDVTRYSIGDGVYAICIYRDQQGKLWLGTVEHGVYRFEDGSFKPFRPHESSE